ncbi:hypothetical protein IMSAGC019_03417 [Lachnospiraceae bacterium]|nr:hypothetical protein IMSAGC019_03417 [Lachnospiraceae bacterium]
MEPLADAGGFLLLRGNLARSRKGGMPCRDGRHAATKHTGTGTLAAIHAAGYDYRGGAVIPRPAKEETYMNGQETVARSSPLSFVTLLHVTKGLFRQASKIIILVLTPLSSKVSIMSITFENVKMDWQFINQTSLFIKLPC